MSRLGSVLVFLSFIFVILWFVFIQVVGPDYPFVWVTLALAGAGLVGSVVKDYVFYKEVFGQRSTKHGMNLGVLVIIVTGILIAVNFLGFRYDKKFDFTKDKLFSLSEQSKKILAGLTEDLEVKAFFEVTKGRAGDKASFKEGVADLFTAESPRLKVTYIDPVVRPDEAKEFDIKSPSVVVIRYKGKTARFESFTEEAFTNAIIQVTRESKKVIYTLSGHGEHSIDDTQPSGASGLKAALGEASYDVKKLDFVTAKEVPADAAVLIVLGPAQALFEKETLAIKDFLYKGGNLFLAADPDKKHELAPFIRELGVEYKNNFVIDPLGQLIGQNAALAIGFEYSPTSDITKSFKETRTIFYLTSQLKALVPKVEGIDVEELVKSSPSSFGKADIYKKDSAQGEAGSLTMLASAKGKLKKIEGKEDPKEFQVVIAGDSDFATNQLISAQLNRDLVMNSVSFLSKEKDLVSIRPKTRESSPFFMTPMQKSFVAMLFLPGALIWFLSWGGFVWYRRRAA